MDKIINETNFGIYAGLLDSILIVNTLVTLIALFLMLYYSPQTMMIYRWYLINITLSCYAMDFWMSTVYRPYAVIIPPTLSGCPTGLLAKHGQLAALIGWVVFIWFMGVCGMSITWGFLYRLFSVYSRAEFMRRPWTVALMTVAQVLYSTPVCGYVIAIWPGERITLDFVKKTAPALYDSFVLHTCALMTLDIPWTFMIIGVLFVMMVIIVNLVFIFCIFRLLRQMRQHMTAKTHDLQKQLAVSLSLQAIIPITMIFFAWIAMIFAVSFRSNYIPEVYMFTVCCSVSHTSANGIVIIFVTKPYRKAFLSIIRQCFNQLNNIGAANTTIVPTNNM